jgi:hypothetical protein
MKMMMMEERLTVRTAGGEAQQPGLPPPPRPLALGLGLASSPFPGASATALQYWRNSPIDTSPSWSMSIAVMASRTASSDASLPRLRKACWTCPMMEARQSEPPPPPKNVPSTQP